MTKLSIIKYVKVVIRSDGFKVRKIIKLLLFSMKNLRLHNVSIHQTQFINECARKRKAKIPKFQSFTFFLE